MTTNTFYLHIGLPKTATTFLQARVFKHLQSLTYVHRAEARKFFRDKGWRSFTSAFRRSPEFWQTEKRNRLALFAKKFGGQKPGLLVSEENVSVSVGFFAPAVKQATPRQVARHLRAMRKAAAAAGIKQFKVILTVRRQDTWLASRYAQSAVKFANPGQEHFEELVDALLAKREGFEERAAWLDYGSLFTLLERAVRPANLHIMPQELLRADPHQALSALGDFLGESDLASLASTDKTNGPSNSAGEDQWKLRSTDGVDRFISLPPPLRKKILTAFGSSNRDASAPRALGLEQLRYF